MVFIRELSIAATIVRGWLDIAPFSQFGADGDLAVGTHMCRALLCADKGNG